MTRSSGGRQISPALSHLPLRFTPPSNTLRWPSGSTARTYPVGQAFLQQSLEEGNHAGPGSVPGLRHDLGDAWCVGRCWLPAVRLPPATRMPPHFRHVRVGPADQQSPCGGCGRIGVASVLTEKPEAGAGVWLTGLLGRYVAGGRDGRVEF